MKKIKLNDEVIIITGKNKDSTGAVIKVLDSKVLVEGLNLAKKHVRSNPNAGVTGGITEIEVPLAVSNVAIYNSATKKADRVGIRTNKDGIKERFFKSNNEVIV
ncbi:LSU ribosomal protein L24P [Candidatus Ruthia magnifica str. Cm (Calyptogena magnifica)]|uniref:Large ribosomal subunit protein uL24 n=1 Tax=Ruthia magnifica subsp. Calyptogena magnifica TaxID=413404 RepID=RL24_RUTMC|nr:50S ribosomal protein L24 [Candidatus Ruthturnera calyptogenae]A1AVL1.1 RecName: Full=Large ribosomal subunit protein uL24; AltName: Full=50S ribosomal protein L24 [Candidatus Ruthia magnifica str. Cm (Calyptogena magnifica)]ABL01968.1 LSU ribosomal protein L24P [Candidatus Ruthia magnifica str. Cm (Calyptogena magnifica)]